MAKVNISNQQAGLNSSGSNIHEVLSDDLVDVSQDTVKATSQFRHESVGNDEYSWETDAVRDSKFNSLPDGAEFTATAGGSLGASNANLAGQNPYERLYNSTQTFNEPVFISRRAAKADVVGKSKFLAKKTKNALKAIAKDLERQFFAYESGTGNLEWSVRQTAETTSRGTVTAGLAAYTQHWEVVPISGTNTTEVAFNATSGASTPTVVQTSASGALANDVRANGTSIVRTTGTDVAYDADHMDDLLESVDSSGSGMPSVFHSANAIKSGISRAYGSETGAQGGASVRRMDAGADRIARQVMVIETDFADMITFEHNYILGESGASNMVMGFNADDVMIMDFDVAQVKMYDDNGHNERGDVFMDCGFKFMNPTSNAIILGVSKS